MAAEGWKTLEIFGKIMEEDSSFQKRYYIIFYPIISMVLSPDVFKNEVKMLPSPSSPDLKAALGIQRDMPTQSRERRGRLRDNICQRCGLCLVTLNTHV